MIVLRGSLIYYIYSMQISSVFMKPVLFGCLATFFLLSCGKSKRIQGDWTVRDIRHNEQEGDSAKLADCQTMVIGLSFLKNGEGQLTNNRGHLFDMNWTYQEDKLTISSEALGREQMVGMTLEGRNTLLLDNCLCTYEFNRQ